MATGNNFIKNRLKSFGYAFKGFLFLIRNEANFQVQIVIAILAIILGFVFDISLLEWFAQLIAIAMVLVAESFNTSIEKMVDFVHKDDHPEIGKIKDISAAACLIISVLALVIGVLLYLPKIVPFL
ncbi:MAG: diacylglycerol kinase [Polaribacter sp.]